MRRCFCSCPVALLLLLLCLATCTALVYCLFASLRVSVLYILD